MPGGCKLQLKDDAVYNEVIASDSKENAAKTMSVLKKMFKAKMAKTLTDMSTKNVPRNMLQEQQFNFRIEGEIENAFQYQDEIT